MSAALKLEVFQNGELLREVSLDGPELWVGRDEDCVIRLEDRAISRKHALLRSNDQGLEFEKKSKFGLVKLNGKEIDQMTLKGGDRLEMGPFEIRVLKNQVEAPAPVVVALKEVAKKEEMEVKTVALPPEDETPAVEMNFSMPEGIEPVMSFESQVIEPEAAPALEVRESNTQAFDFAKVENDGATKVMNGGQQAMKAVLQFGDGAANVSQYEISDLEIAIGRSQKCHVVLEDKRSSRKHSLIKREGNRYILKDLGSANGTLVNGERVDEHELQSGDQIQIGDTQFSFKMLQKDYDQKKEEFIQVASEEMAPQYHAGASAQGLSMFEEHPVSSPFDLPPAPPVNEPAPDFAAPKEKKKSFIGKFLDRYRAMNTKQQIIYGAVILVGIYYLMDDEPVEKKAHLNLGDVKKTAQVQKKGADRKPGSGQSFESLTPEQQRYIETEYQLAFDLYKNREYDNSLLEVGKIFSLVQDYKNAREVEAFAREGKRKLETQEDERKKKEQERLAQVKLQSLLEQVNQLMESKRYAEAEALFPEIELLQPENLAVGEWRKRMISEKEKGEKEAQEKKAIADYTHKAWADFEKAKSLAKDKNYWDALDAFDELAERTVADKKFKPSIQEEIKKAEDQIAAERDPVLAQAKQLEQEGKLSDAYKMYQKAEQIDSSDPTAPAGMSRIRGTLSSKAKSIYAEGVFAESYTDLETAEKRYREVLEVVPNDDDYFAKATTRLKRITVLRRPASEGIQ